MSMQYLHPITTDGLRRAGITAPWGFGIADRVRFGELDALGHVNNTAYLRWFENLRLPYLAARHVTDDSPNSPRLVLKRTSCDYMAEMFGGMDYIVTGRTRAFRATSFTMEFGVFLPNHDGPAKQMAAGEAILVLLSPTGDGRYPIPALSRDAFIAEDGALAERA
ncbi:acyl-CoA thioesterase [Rhodobacterales bacterium LSUCC0031]|nr:acyl-CoA thioesterase [Rhodobacterales bacterium LSUCC0031]